MRKELINKSKFLSMVLRHDPGKVCLTLDSAGWVDIESLLAAAKQHHYDMSRGDLDEIVRTNDKSRFAIDSANDRIRARQGHSVDVDLGLVPTRPPDRLYHGTVERFMDAIRTEGLQPGERHHVHLSATTAIARNVGARRGKPIVLTVRAGEMAQAGHDFYVSENGVWLTDFVPPEFVDTEPDM